MDHEISNTEIAPISISNQSELPKYKSEPIPKNITLLYTWAIGIAIGSFVMGYFFVIVSVLSSSLAYHIGQKYETNKQNTSLYISICTAILPMGGLLGSLLYTKIVTFIKSQHKLSLICDLGMILLLTIQLTTLDIYLYTIIRFLQGFLIGIYGIIIPKYLISISPTNISGRIGSFNQIMITIGIAVAYAMGYIIDQQNLNNSLNWRICVAFPIPFILIKILINKYFDYEPIQRHIQNQQWKQLYQYIEVFYQKDSLSLQDLIKSKNIDIIKIRQRLPKTKNMLNQVYNTKISQNTKKILKQTIKCQQNQQQLQNIEKQKKNTSGTIMRQLISITICILNQFCGINAILFYANQLFLDISHGDSNYAVRKSLELGLFQIFITLISGGVMDRFGRRTLMIGGQILIIFALVSGYYMIDFDQESHWDPQYVTYAIFLHMAGFSLSLGPISVVYISQVVEDISPYMTFVWVQTILISLVSNIMIQKFGTGKVFLFFAIISVVGLIYLIKYMLQTKGKTRKQVVKSYDSIKTPKWLTFSSGVKQYNQVSQNQRC